MRIFKLGSNASPAFFAAGWRPFFLATGAMGAVAVPVWLAALAGHLPLGVDWHAHEMIFGFGFAALAGFLLTAIPNWTGREPLSGTPLAALFILWCAGRLAALFAVFPIVDAAFLPTLGVVSLHAVAKARNRRNYGVVLVVFLLGACNVAYHSYDQAIGLEGAIWLLTILIAVIGGRITPAFTQSALRQAGRTDIVCSTPRWLDRGTVALIAATGLASLGAPGSLLSSGVALAAAAAAAARMVGWHSLETWRTPIVWILHVGMAWLPVALLLHAVSELDPAFFDVAATHAFTAGLIGTMILAVASRAALGHSGRPLVASPPTVLAYVLVSSGALLRVAAPWHDAVIASGVLWSLGYALFTVAYVRVVLAPRADGKPG